MTEQRRRVVIVGAAALALIVLFLTARRRNPATAELVPSMPTAAELEGPSFGGGDWGGFPDVVSDPWDPELIAAHTSAITTQTSMIEALKSAIEAIAAKVANPASAPTPPASNVVVPAPVPMPSIIVQPPSVSTRPSTPEPIPEAVWTVPVSARPSEGAFERAVIAGPGYTSTPAPDEPGPQPGPLPPLWIETDAENNLVTRPGLIPPGVVYAA